MGVILLCLCHSIFIFINFSYICCFVFIQQNRFNNKVQYVCSIRRLDQFFGMFFLPPQDYNFDLYLKVFRHEYIKQWKIKLLFLVVILLLIYYH